MGDPIKHLIEPAFKETKTFYRAILDAMEDMVSMVDTDFRLIWANRAMYETCKRMDLQLEPLDRPILDVFPFLGDSILQEYAQVLTTREPVVSEEINQVGHQEVITRTTKIPVIEENRVIGVLAVMRDMTAQRRSEQELARMAKLRSLGIMAGGLAHDFNNLLMGIHGNLELARSAHHTFENRDQLIIEAIAACHRATGITRQLLTFASGGNPLTQPINLTRMLKEIVAFTLRGSRCVPVFNLPVDLRPVLADTDQLAQVISNLILNAMQAMPTGGTITINATNLDLDATQDELSPGPYVLWEITDEGFGIAPEHLNQVFDPFFTTKAKGSGLGLAVVHSVIARHHGHIRVLSQLGLGTTFRILLPTASEQLPTTESAIKSPQQSLRILFMEDEEVVAKVVILMLNGLGHQVEHTVNGRGTIDVYQQAKNSGIDFDVAILDLTTPGDMNGLQTLQHLRQMNPQIRAIVCSGYNTGTVLADYQAHGFVARLCKPFGLQDLIQALAQAIPAN